MISINAMIKDGGYKTLTIDKEMMSHLAESVQKQGFEYVTLASGVIEVVGFVVAGSLTGDRVIILGNSTKEHEFQDDDEQEDKPCFKMDANGNLTRI